MRSVWLIARSVLIEAVRRREVYAIVLVSVLMIGAVMTVDFFQVRGLTKFYREMALKIMSCAAALTVVILAARQLPREFENRTIYPLLAKPLGRPVFLVGKLLGVMLAAAFCFMLFMSIFVAGSFYLGAPIPWALFAQYIYLQMLMMLVLATLSFLLSMVMNLDAAITVAVIFYAASSTITAAMSYLYDYMSAFGQVVLGVLNFAIPHLTLFDLSGKAVHADVWEPLGWSVMLALTLYGGVFAGLYLGGAMLSFRRRPL